MFPHRLGFVFLLALCALLFAPRAHAQADGILGKTDFGKSHNTDEDLMNSLAPGPKKYWKGEKNQEVDSKSLERKPVKDPMFQGGLMDVGLDWRGNKMGKAQATTQDDSKKTDKKSEPAAGEKDPKAANASTESAKKESKSSQPEVLPLQVATADPVAEALSYPEKDQEAKPTGASAKSNDKPASEKPSDQDAKKDSDKKPDGEH